VARLNRIRYDGRLAAARCTGAKLVEVSRDLQALTIAINTLAVHGGLVAAAREAEDLLDDFLGLDSDDEAKSEHDKVLDRLRTALAGCKGGDKP
jgi:hypothetical protein